MKYKMLYVSVHETITIAIRLITKLPKYKASGRRYNAKPKRAYVQVYQWPNGSYSLFVRKPTKTWGRYAEGMCVGTYFVLDKAEKAAVKWLLKHRK